eukprot:scaffold60075_cov31-Tisochrysis_lutea.AAC.4
MSTVWPSHAGYSAPAGEAHAWLRPLWPPPRMSNGVLEPIRRWDGTKAPPARRLKHQAVMDAASLRCQIGLVVQPDRSRDRRGGR